MLFWLFGPLFTHSRHLVWISPGLDYTLSVRENEVAIYKFSGQIKGKQQIQ